MINDKAKALADFLQKPLIFQYFILSIFQYFNLAAPLLRYPDCNQPEDT